MKVFKTKKEVLKTDVTNPDFDESLGGTQVLSERDERSRRPREESGNPIGAAGGEQHELQSVETFRPRV